MIRFIFRAELNTCSKKQLSPKLKKMKVAMAHDANVDVSHCCTEIGILVALKNQAKDLIEKL